MTKIDTIIIGQGLAGSMLAWKLIKFGQHVLIIDNSHRHSASVIAAGIINPITGKRFVLHPQTKQHLQSAIHCYREIERIFKASFFHSIVMNRILNSLTDKQQLEKRLHNPDYADFISKPYSTSNTPIIHAPFGGFYQPNTGYLDMDFLLKRLKHYFIQKNCYREEKINYHDIKPESDSVNYKSYCSDRLIFCEGHQIINNPWFGHLPIVPTKGEILTLRQNNINPTEIINNGKWLLPVAGGLFKFGSSYEINNSDATINHAVRAQLLNQLAKMTTSNRQYELVNHSAGIRPCTTDRSPLLGMHPRTPRLGVFNGFGSNAALTAPYYAEQFSHYLCEGKHNNYEKYQNHASIERFKYDRELNVFS